ncbi:MAG: YeeE/YedE family protein [Acidimicrobiia bacterium]|nr:YeeE/YedE family protein [Acidimicrobiia bacterium]
MLLLVTGVGAGLAMGYALQRTKLALHGSFAGLPDRIPRVFRTWLLAVMIGVLGLTAVFASDMWPQLSRGLPFRPLPNIVGGLLLGFGMVLAVTTASGLFYNLGSGAVTCLVGLVGFMAGDAIGGWFEFPGDKGVLAAGEGATLPGVLDVPHWSVAVPLAVVVILALAFWPVSPEAPRARDQLGWVVGGTVLGLALVGAWILAGVGGHDFGPNTEGFVSSLIRGQPDEWEGSFVVALIPGAAAAALLASSWSLSRAHAGRLLRLFVGGLLLGLGGQIAGGCNLGHGLSGVAQLSLSSWLVVAAIVGGIMGGRRVLTVTEAELHEMGDRLG